MYTETSGLQNGINFKVERMNKKWFNLEPVIALIYIEKLALRTIYLLDLSLWK